MTLPRSSGILLHPTSLPGGRLGEEAYRFVDWLASAGQSWWQMLPLGPPDASGSPYVASSAFAGWTGLLAEPKAPVTANELEDFVARHAFWIGDWAAYAGAGAVAGQVRFEREWSRLRAYAAARGVRLIGDLPIYVAAASADHALHPELFQRGAVAGVPPDAFSRDGQLWGNPLYEWPAHRATEFRWWLERFRRTFELVDLTRIDHFRGLVAYWAVPEGRKTARRGRWRRAPGRELLATVRNRLGRLPVIAEDLGLITPAVHRLRDEFGLPGMAVMHWAWHGGVDNPHALANQRDNQVVYTGTHDNDTAVGWFRSLPRAIRERTGLDAREPHWALIEAAFSSRAALALVPAQDVLGLGSEARMNTPATRTGNWRWRLGRGQLTDEHAARLRELTDAAGRLPGGGRASRAEASEV
ncbi:MAG: 4-alpha-glucanotransferase [Thermoleophilia bacterium]|nr:4-alpha-glucanotransferase [Thermoleophilia bacterium]